MPAFLEQGETPASEIKSRIPEMIDRTPYGTGKTFLEEEQIQDLFLAVGRPYVPGMDLPTFQRRFTTRQIEAIRKAKQDVKRRNEGLSLNFMGVEAPTPEEEEARAAKVELGESPYETFPTIAPTGVSMSPVAITAVEPKDEGVVAAPVVKPPLKTKQWLIVGGLSIVAIILGAWVARSLD